MCAFTLDQRVSTQTHIYKICTCHIYLRYKHTHSLLAHVHVFRIDKVAYDEITYCWPTNSTQIINNNMLFAIETASLAYFIQKGGLGLRHPTSGATLRLVLHSGKL